MKYLLVILCITSVFKPTAGQTPGAASTKEIDRVVTKIVKVNELMGEAVGYAGSRPPQYDNFVELEHKAGKAALIDLTDHSNAVVRCYAFWALSHDPTADLFPIVVKHIDDNEEVKTLFGCIGSREKVGDFFISVVTPTHVDLESKKLDSLQLMELDSILIYSANELNARSDAIIRAKRSPQLYSKVRELVIEKKEPSALVVLAKYNKQEDIELILKSNTPNRYFTYQAINEFPDPAFLPFLEKSMLEVLDDTHYGNEWRVMYSAIARYKNNKALELLKKALAEAKVPEIRKYHVDFIFDALEENAAPLYEDLLWDLWQKENKISPRAYKYLSTVNSARAYELTRNILQDPAALYAVNITFNDESSGSETLASVMLDLAMQQEREFGMDVIRKNIKEANVHLFPVFAHKVAQLKDQAFIEPLFQRLEMESNPHVYLKVAETLIKYNDTDINRRILLAKNKNKNLSQGWGGEALDKLLSENNIR